MTLIPCSSRRNEIDDDDELETPSFENLLELQTFDEIVGDLYQVSGFPFEIRSTSGKILYSKSDEASLSVVEEVADGDEFLVNEADLYSEYENNIGQRIIHIPLQINGEPGGELVLGPFFRKEDQCCSESQLGSNLGFGLKGKIRLEDSQKYPVFEKVEVERMVRLYSNIVSSHLEQAFLRLNLDEEYRSHQKTQGELKIQDSYFRNLFENAPDAIVLLDNQDRILRINQEFEKMFGYSKKEAMSRKINDLIVPDGFKHEGSRSTEKVAAGENIDIATIRISKDGQPLHVTILGKPIVMDNNQLAVYGIYRNISEKVKAEKIQNVMHRISEISINSSKRSEFFGQIYTELHDVVPAAGLFIELFDKARNEFQIPILEEQYDDFQVLNYAHTLSSLVVEQGQLLCLEKDQILEVADRKQLKLSELPERWLGIPLVEGKDVIGVLGVKSFDEKNFVSHDTLKLLEFISAQVATTIRRSQTDFELRKLYRSLEQSPSSVIITDLNGRIEYVNPKFCAISGFDAEEVNGKNPRILNSGLNPRSTYQSLWEHLQDGKEWNGEFLNRKKNGDLYWERANISPVKDNGGRITHYIGVKEDITERKKIEQDLMAAKVRAEESDHLKSVFLANMSHELRTPLNAIIGFSNLCDEALPKDKILEFVQLINKSGHQLLSIIEDVLNFSCLERGQSDLKNEKFLLENFLLDFYNLAKDKRENENKEDIEIHLKPDSGYVQVVVETDAQKLQQVLMNLFKNALKFTDIGHVEIGYVVKGDRLNLFVKDTGVGISKEKQDVIFESFRQGDNSTTRRFGGAGLGLSLSKRVIELMGGEIWVESEIGLGAKFWISLPCIIAAQQNDAEEKVLLESQRKKERPTILVAEDELSNFKLISAILKRNNFDIIRAENGEEVVEICRQNKKIDLVLMDIKMPVLNGLDATTKIREFNPNLPIVAQTAFALDQDREKAIRVGCNDYISKPIKMEKLLSIINKLLREQGKSND
ncbi:MAG: PAS domain S-box protein [Marinifilaceae bacterium]